MPPIPETTVVVLGPETMANLRLSETFRRLLGSDRVVRHLEIPHLFAFLGSRVETPTVVFVDLFGFDLPSITAAIGDVRTAYPRVVFGIYRDTEVWHAQREQLPGEWADRLGHYFTLRQVPDDEEFEPIARLAYRETSAEAEYNFGHEPIRITEGFDAGVLQATTPEQASTPGTGTIFVSYSRSDWEDNVAEITDRLRALGFQLWVDQAFLVGGDDWMDAIGEALKACSVCLLCMSPAAIQSKYVKMEYRYFFNNDKPIVPVMVRPLADIPPELLCTQYFDFTGEDAPPYETLRQVIAGHRSG